MWKVSNIRSAGAQAFDDSDHETIGEAIGHVLNIAMEYHDLSPTDFDILTWNEGSFIVRVKATRAGFALVEPYRTKLKLYYTGGEIWDHPYDGAIYNGDGSGREMYVHFKPVCFTPDGQWKPEVIEELQKIVEVYTGKVLQ